MSSTRRAVEGAPLNQERYMSSPEYLELRGISGSAVTAKAALMGHPTKKSLLFFLQQMSLQPGGLQKFTREFLEMFPERIGSPTMLKLGMKPGQKYSEEVYRRISEELLPGQEQFLESLREFGDTPSAPKLKSAEDCILDCRERCGGLPGFIIELCINPKLRFAVPGETSAAMEKERIVLEEQFPGRIDSAPWTNRASPSGADLPWFNDVIGALFEFKRRHEELTKARLVTTEVCKAVFETLDVGLATGKMVVLQGESRIGKTTATEAWCRLHQGEARYVSLSGILTKTDVFRAIAKALGIASSYARTATEMRLHVEDVLQRSGLMLVIDEAHFLLSPLERVRTAPEMIEWINTSLCNYRVPVALVCTPQLSYRMARHERQAGWNADQWRGRVKRFRLLPDTPRKQDLRAVAESLLPSASRETLDLIVGYALSSKLHMPAVVDAIDEAKLIAIRDNRKLVTFGDVEMAIRDNCAPSATAMAQTRMRFAGRGSRLADRKFQRDQGPVSFEEDNESLDATPTTTRAKPLQVLGTGVLRASAEALAPT